MLSLTRINSDGHISSCQGRWAGQRSSKVRPPIVPTTMTYQIIANPMRKYWSVGPIGYPLFMVVYCLSSGEKYVAFLTHYRQKFPDTPLAVVKQLLELTQPDCRIMRVCLMRKVNFVVHLFKLCNLGWGKWRSDVRRKGAWVDKDWEAPITLPRYFTDWPGKVLCTNVSISADISWRALHILMEPISRIGYVCIRKSTE